jgi:hypothetical protein
MTHRSRSHSAWHSHYRPERLLASAQSTVGLLMRVARVATPIRLDAEI